MKRWACAACHESDVPRYNSRAIICELCRDSARARNLAWCTGDGKPHRVNAADMRKDGSRCRVCDAARSAERYARNRERYAAVARDAYWAKRDANLERKRRYRATHPGRWRNVDPVKQRERNRRYRAAHRAELDAKVKAWKAANREAVRAHDRRYRLRRKLQILRGWRRAA